MTKALTEEQYEAIEFFYPIEEQVPLESLTLLDLKKLKALNYAQYDGTLEGLKEEAYAAMEHNAGVTMDLECYSKDLLVVVENNEVIQQEILKKCEKREK